MAQGRPGRTATADQLVELRSEACGLYLRSQRAQLASLAEFMQVKNKRADGDSQMGLAIEVIQSSERAVWKALQGKADGGIVRGIHPALPSPESIRSRYSHLRLATG